MAKTFYYLFKEIRPRQWIKNLTVFAAIFFNGKLLDPQLLNLTILAFFSLCAASSTIYIINDLTDIEKDKLHPFKRNRPIASGKLPKQIAIFSIFVLLSVALIFAASISSSFFLLILIFIAMHIGYSLYLKNLILFDILTISAGFILRVFSGEVATGYHLNIWLFLTVVSVALFLAIGKRRSELTLLSAWDGAIASKTRATLSHYSERMLDVYLSMFANSAWITYAFYTFLEKPPAYRNTITRAILDNDLSIVADRKWLMLTIPIVLYGIMRYLQLIYEKNQGESPEKVILSDKPLIITALLLGAMLFSIIYIIGKY